MGKRFTRSSTDKKIGGVCGGLAAYLDWDPLLVRVLTVALVFVSAGFALVAYLLLWWLAPES